MSTKPLVEDGKRVKTVDVVVIGAGLVGAAVAFELHRAGHRVVVCEAESELGAGASRSNSGVLHTGFDSPPGTFETAMILRQSGRWREVFGTLGIPFRTPGALLLAHGNEVTALERLEDGAAQNGAEVHLLGREAVRRLEPGISADAALHIPGEAITDPLEVITRLLYGIEVQLGCTVMGLGAHADGLRLETHRGELQSSFVVNCAGLFADELTREFEITPRRGEFIVFERGSAALARHILLPLPNSFTKGVLVFPTLYDHLCAGPTAEDQHDKRDWKPRPAALADLRHQAVAALPALRGVPVVSAWAGLRPAGTPHNYLCRFSEQLPGLLHLAGIRSTGLSACLGLSSWALEQLTAHGLPARPPRPLQTPPQSISQNIPQPWWERLNALRGVHDPLAGTDHALRD